jgi:hypothetical protein
MTGKPLECADIRRGFLAGRVAAGPELDAHLRDCAECRELFEDDARLGRSLAASVLPEPELGGLLEIVEGDLRREQGLRARLRALPARWRSGILIGVAAALVAAQLLWHPRPDLNASRPAVVMASLLLGAALVLGAVRLTRGLNAPLGSGKAEPVLGAALLGVPALVAVLAPLGSALPEAALAWGNPGACFGYGAALVAPMILLYWLFERRDRPPASALISAGALAGVAANLLLCAHCASAHPGHLLLGHVSIGVAWALALWLGLRSAQLAR